MVGVRWAFHCGGWKPSAQEWKLALASIQPEERLRILRFVFQKDAKAALAARLLMRKAVAQQTGLAYRDVCFSRTEKGKPFLVNSPPGSVQLDFNVSHDGSYSVLALETSCLIGVDTMQVDRPPGCKSVTQFFSTMSRQLTGSEWASINSSLQELDQLAAFYRYWCLKESYVKALGIGIGLSLDRLECRIHSPLSSFDVVCNTEVWLDGQADVRTSFEESLLDKNHLVAVAMKQNAVQVSSGRNAAKFTLLSATELFTDVEQLTEPRQEDWDAFCAKLDKPSSLKS